MTPIQALPQQTVRILGASQVITTPDSVVKELIDNALDANARAIFVEISSNTLDVVQVRDSGHGIAPEDRDLVCRRYCTSRIQNEDELRIIGGTWLGFRGEALASLAELSGALSVSTRVEGEGTAVNLKIGPEGEVKGRDTASQPVGTTVRATDLFKHLPVRKQAALKAVARSLAKIKRTMQAYAMARPSVRFSLKVLKAKSDKSNWTYAPKPNAGIEDAAFKVVGNGCASQCHFSSMEQDAITVQAFVPKMDADPAKLSGGGYFFSVDSRPVSATRGFLKRLLDVYKEKLRASNSRFSDVKEPFIWLNIVCPPGVYDANVEPAKDDVVFEDSEKVMEVFERLLEICYPSPTAPLPASPPLENQRPFSRRRSTSFTIFEDEQDEQLERPASKRRRTWKPNMYEGGADSGDDISMISENTLAQNEPEDNVDDLSPSKGMNPFMLAKMNARSPRKVNMPQRIPSQPLQDLSDQEIIAQQENPSGLPAYPPWALPTPENSSPARAQQQRPMSNRKESLGFSLPSSSGVADSDAHQAADDAGRSQQAERAAHQRPNNDFVSARHLPLNSTHSSIVATSMSDAAPISDPALPPLLASHPAYPRIERSRPPRHVTRPRQTQLPDLQPVGTYNDPLGMVETQPSPQRKTRREIKDRSNHDMFVGRAVDRPFKPPQRRPRQEQQRQQQPQFDEDAPAPAPATRPRNLHPDFETPSQVPDVASSEVGQDEMERFFAWQEPEPHLPSVGHNMPALQPHQVDRVPMLLPLEGPLDNLQRLLKPLSLSITALTELQESLNALLTSQQHDGAPDSSQPLYTEGLDDLSRSSLTEPAPGQGEVDSWRGMILQWLTEREGEEFVEKLLQDEEDEARDIVDVAGGLRNPGLGMMELGVDGA